MTMHRRLSALERRLPAPSSPCPPVAMPTLAEFQTLARDHQEEVLLFAEPGWAGDPPPDPGAAQSLEDYRQRMEAQVRAGREVLLPYVASLAIVERTELYRRAIQILPPEQMWRLQVLRFACRAEWMRRREEEAGGEDGRG